MCVCEVSACLGKAITTCSVDHVLWLRKSHALRATCMISFPIEGLIRANASSLGSPSGSHVNLNNVAWLAATLGHPNPGWVYLFTTLRYRLLVSLWHLECGFSACLHFTFPAFEPFVLLS